MYELIATVILCASLTENGDPLAFRGDQAPTRQTAKPKKPDADLPEARLGKVLAEVSYIGEDLDDALAELADEAGVNLVVDWPALEAIGIYGDTRIDLSLQYVTTSDALTAVLKVADQRHLGAAFMIRDGLLNVTSKAELDRQFEVRTYDCAALLQLESIVRGSRPEGSIGPLQPHRPISALRWRRHLRLLGLPPFPNLAETVQSTVDPDSWERRGGLASVRMFGGKLVVRQTHSIHVQIERLLASLSHSATRQDRRQSE